MNEYDSTTRAAVATGKQTEVAVLAGGFCNATALLPSVQSPASALERSRAVLSQEAEIHALRDAYASLSRREREVLELVVSGKLNKQVGGELGISEITVKAHRGKLIRKMKAGSLADLVKMAGKLSSAPTSRA